MDDGFQIDEIEWRGIIIRIRYNPNRWKSYEESYGYPLAQLEIKSTNEVPLPITDTGYLSYNLSPQNVEEEGGAVSFVRAWLEFKAQSPEWLAKQEQVRQLDLF